MVTTNIPLSLYIHIPWCERKCPYCDFNSHETTTIPEYDYVNALVSDIQQSLHFIEGKCIQSIFFGGGTPSLFNAEAIHEILNNAFKHFSVASNCEITLEANPSSLERHKFYDYRLSGINRLSIGVQSFQNELLKRLGRIHNSDDAILAVEQAQNAGFDNINIDLMTGLPNQSYEQSIADIQQAIDLQVQHISWYELTIEPNTTFYSKPPVLPTETLIDSFDQVGKQLLKANGFNRYEISAYSKPNQQCKHNINYWQYGDYLGIGAGAHSKISTINNELMTILRFSKRKQPTGYMQNQQAVNQTQVINNNILSDYLLNALRLINGFKLQHCTQRTGLSLSEVTNSMQTLQNQNFISIKNNTVIPTHLGINFQNEAIMAID